MMSKLFYKVVNVLSLVTMLALSSNSMALDLSAQDYITMDLQVRQATLDGVQARAQLMEQGGDLDAQFALDTQIQQTVTNIYSNWGMTSAQAVVWATHHFEEVQTLLTTQPSLQAEYDRISRELDEASALIQAMANR